MWVSYYTCTPVSVPLVNSLTILLFLCMCIFLISLVSSVWANLLSAEVLWDRATCGILSLRISA